MKYAIVSLLIIALCDMALDNHFDKEDVLSRKAGAVLHSATSSSTSYDVDGLNKLVGHLERHRSSDEQAAAAADLWNITKEDLDSKVNIFGERE